MKRKSDKSYYPFAKKDDDLQLVIAVVAICIATLVAVILFRVLLPHSNATAAEKAVYVLQAGGKQTKYTVTEVVHYNNGRGGNAVRYTCSDGTKIQFEHGLCVVEKKSGTETYIDAYIVKE